MAASFLRKEAENGNKECSSGICVSQKEGALWQIGIQPEIVVSHVVEQVTSSVPSEVVMELASQKAADVAAGRKAGETVIGSDTVVAIDGKILGKPKTHEEAREMIGMLSGRVHQVYTGVCVILKGEDGNDRSRVFFDKTDVEVYPLTEEEIFQYAMSEEPMDKAGAYGVQGFFARYIKGLKGSYANVMGLPVSRLYQELKELNGI